MLPARRNLLGKLILEKMEEQCLSRKQIAPLLGYKNPHKGFVRLDDCINHGRFTADFLERISRVLTFDPPELQRACKQNAAFLDEQERELTKIRQREKEKQLAEEEAHERATFTPHLWAITEHKIGHPIFLIAIAGQDRYRRVDLPDGIEKMADEQQVEVIRNAARRHFNQIKGSAGPFGRILGYWYRHAYDQSWLIATTGGVVHRNGGVVGLDNIRFDVT